MHLESRNIVFTPTDLTLFMESPFASWMEHLALVHPESLPPCDKKDELVDSLKKKGIQHEANILESFYQKNLVVAQIEKETDKTKATLDSMTAGVDIIYQAALQLIPLKGYADFLVKKEGESKFGDYHYEVWDSKLKKTIKPSFIIQLCCYAEILEEIQGRRPENLTLVLGTGDTIHLKTNDYFYYYRNLKNCFLQAHEEFSIENCPSPADSSHFGRWSDYAEELLKKADHLCQVATITKSQIKKLNKSGISKMIDLAETPLTHLTGINPEVFSRLKSQAKIQKESAGKEVPLYQLYSANPNKKIGLYLLPPTSPLDIYFDIEGYPLVEGGIEYLWGVSYLDEKGQRLYKDFWAHNQDEEKTTFKAFIDWAYARWTTDPQMHIYHYANYEISACRKLMGRYGICEYEVDQLLRNEVFVDLYKVVKGGLLIGEPRYSIKNVEHLYRGKRTTDVGSGGDSIVVYERWLEEPDGDTWETSAILKSIRDYNIDDCNSTQELTEWLRQRQQEQGISYIGKTEIEEPEEKEEVTIRIQLRDRLLAKSYKLAEEGLEEEAKLASLFAWVLEYHRREQKPMYWRLFDRLSLTDEELIDDIDCLALCIRTETAPCKLKPKDRNLIYEYRFDPTQEFKADCEKYFVLGKIKPDGKNLCVEFIKEKSNLPEGLIALKSSLPLGEIITLIPDESIPIKPIPEAIAAQVETFEKGELNNTAILDFLKHGFPRIKGHQMGEPIAVSPDPNKRLLEIINVVKNLDNSYLTIQGPPGSGKTYTATHVIAELLKLGKKIGISSNSHKAINHLLIKTAEYCKEKDIKSYFACTKETDAALKELNIDVYKNENITAHLQDGCLIGTPAWGFARNDLVDAFDYLFIDEAGQVCVANLIGMSRSTKNIILMGDQMQLSQPSQGCHPEDSGLSILDYLLHSTPTIPDNMGVFLGTTYRMHSTINKFISDAIYEGKLKSAPENDRRYIKVPKDYHGPLNKEAGIIPIPVFHEGNTQASDEEVEEIVKLARQLLGRTLKEKNGEERLVTWNDMLFVAPYNHQVNKLKVALGKEARVGSVDKFQGQEAPIVFLSMCSSDASESARGLDFLLEKNRLNVAISRAKCLSIILFCPNLPKITARNTKQLQMLNLFYHLINIF
ncbi:putative RNA helicase [Legionella santicrucis]|uniref:Putative RNA helicase n=1 Tax=Legionella santicrucis TaxID=45074 RepID=A0A0W0YQF9_9GAMM|nr:TM0106 family RecB-like putative nuclease [Legionella santicrucis]KTD59060.1 putative RNA helicase [Legionella santicrucis]